MEDGMQPLVSVVMATFNESPEQIRGSIGSVLQQTYGNIEVFIIDDSTEPATKAAIDSYAGDKRVSITRPERRLGVSKARNFGLSSAKGKYVALMDGDDVSRNDRIEKQVEFMERNPDVDVLGSYINICDANGKVTSKREYPLGGAALRLFSLMRNPLANPTAMFRRTIVDEGFFYDESLSRVEDFDLWLRLMNSGYKVRNYPECLLDYRVCGDLSRKRGKANWRALVRVRIRNFSLRRPLYSLISLVFAVFLYALPDSFFSKAYKAENGQ